MRTTFTLFGAAAVATTFGLFGCTGAETTGGIEVGGAGGSATIPIVVPDERAPVLLPVHGGTTTQGGAGGTTETAQGGSGGTTETAQGGDTGGSGGTTTQTLTITEETTPTTGTGTGTGTGTDTGTTTIGGAKADPESGSPTSGPPPTEGTPGTHPGSPLQTPVDLPVSVDACPGPMSELLVDRALKFEGSLKGMSDNFLPRCGAIKSVDAGSDVVYQIIVREELTVGIDLFAEGFFPALSIRHSACEAERVDDLCIYTADSYTKTDLALGPGTYWFVVDSGNGQSGSYSLAIHGAAATCGDGVVNPVTEECDPGPAQDNDGCYDPGHELGCMYGAPYNTAGLNVGTTP